jgi:hypothetical protein
MGLVRLGGDPVSLPANTGLTIVGAINAAISRYYINSPGHRKTTPITSLLKAPETVSMTLTHGSRVITGGSPTFDDRIGDTFSIGSKRMVLGPSGTLREPWPQASGTYSGVLSDDAVPIFSPIRTVAGSVIFNEERRLIFMSETPVAEDHLQSIPRITGSPQYYSVENLGDAVGSGLRAFLRVFPAPAEASTIRFLGAIEPQSLTLANLQNPVSLYMPDSDIETFIIPFIGAELASGTLWPEGVARDPAFRRGEEAQEFLRLYHEPTGGVGRVLTPAGY